MTNWRQCAMHGSRRHGTSSGVTGRFTEIRLLSGTSSSSSSSVSSSVSLSSTIIAKSQPCALSFFFRSLIALTMFAPLSDTINKTFDAGISHVVRHSLRQLDNICPVCELLSSTRLRSAWRGILRSWSKKLADIPKKDALKPFLVQPSKQITTFLDFPIKSLSLSFVDSNRAFIKVWSFADPNSHTHTHTHICLTAQFIVALSVDGLYFFKSKSNHFICSKEYKVTHIRNTDWAGQQG